VQIVFGSRPTGKSTLIRGRLPDAATIIDLAEPEERGRDLSDPGRFVALCRSLPSRRTAHRIFFAETQSVPSIFDAVRHLSDREKRRWRFILCGSSARKLRPSGANLLPGRSFLHRLFPLTLTERPAPMERFACDAPPLVPLPWPHGENPTHPFPAADLLDRLACGDLPGVVTLPRARRAPLLHACTQLHLEEEMRREAMVKDWPAFVRFLRFTATNYRDGLQCR
jgi:predicted AAA+ superfamily ATPase